MHEPSRSADAARADSLTGGSVDPVLAGRGEVDGELLGRLQSAYTLARGSA